MRLNAQDYSDSSAWTDPSVEEPATNTVRNSSSTFQFYDWKMSSALEARDFEPDRNGVLAARLKKDEFVFDSEINVHGNSSSEGLMWSMLVVPDYVPGTAARSWTHSLAAGPFRSLAKLRGLKSWHAISPIAPSPLERP